MLVVHIYIYVCVFIGIQAQRQSQSGDQPAVLRQAIAVKALVCSSCLEPPCHQRQDPQELKPGPSTDDQQRPDT